MSEAKKQTRRLRVYVAGPYTKGDTILNIRTAILAGEKLRARGFCPFIPHLTAFWHIIAPSPYEEWLDLDNQFLPCCDVLLRIPGESSGADSEVALARSLSMLVFTNIDSLIGMCSPTTSTDERHRRDQEDALKQLVQMESKGGTNDTASN